MKMVDEARKQWLQTCSVGLELIGAWRDNVRSRDTGHVVHGRNVKVIYLHVLHTHVHTYILYMYTYIYNSSRQQGDKECTKFTEFTLCFAL